MAKKLIGDEQLYFVALVPPEPLLSEMWRLKEYFRDVYQSSKSLNSPPHITLHMPFKWKEKRETELVRVLDACCQKVSPFDVRLTGFGAFEPRVIYLQPEESFGLRELQKSVAKAMRLGLNIFNADYQDRGFHPHITLAFRDLKKERFQEAWKEFSTRAYSQNFCAGSICLLKHNGTAWQALKEFTLSSPTSAGAGEHPVEETE